MKVVVDRKVLLEAVGVLSAITSGRKFRPQLGCILWTAKKSGKQTSLELAATDAEVSMRLMVEEVDVLSPGQVLIDSARTLAILSTEIGPTVRIESDEVDAVEIAGERAKFRVFGYKPDEFPPIPDFAKAEGDSKTLRVAFDCECAAMDRAIAQCLFAVATENSRYAMNGAMVKRVGEKAVVVATDGRRLSESIISIDNAIAKDGAAAILPTKACAIIRKIAAAQIDKADEGDSPSFRFLINDNQAMIRWDGGTLATNLIEGTFPPYDDVIPKELPIVVLLNRAASIDAIRAAGLMVGESGPEEAVRVAFTRNGNGDGKCLLTSRRPEAGEATVECDTIRHEGADITIGFRPRYLTDCLSVIGEDEAALKLSAPNKPALFVSESFRHVVVPVAL